MRKSTLIISVFALLFMFSCKKDSDTTPSQNSNLITVTVGGLLTANGNPFPNASVHIGNEIRKTDENGVFWFKDIEVPENRTYITVNEPDFFHGSRTIYPKEGSSSFVKMILLSKYHRGTFEADNGGTIEMAGNAKIILPAKSVVTRSGQSYSGTVKVAAVNLNPDISDISEAMPGDLTGINDADEDVILATYGMMGIELIGESGESLQIAPGKQAELHFRKLDESLSHAPATIPLWYFDEVKGIWNEEGQAELEGEQYIGKVSHFSFWNCDAPFRVTNLEGRFIFDSGNPLAFAKVSITLESTAEVRHGRTDDNGVFNGKIPVGESLILELKDDCETVISNSQIGPFSSDTALDPIVVPNTGLMIKGKLIDCNGNNVQTGYAKIELSSQEILVPVDNGAFEASILNCQSSSVTVSACDIENSKLAPAQMFDFEPILDVGSLTACEEDLDGFISWSTKGRNYFIKHPSGFLLNSGKIFLEGYEDDEIAIIIEGSSVGTFPIDTETDFLEGLSTTLNVADFKAEILNFNGIGSFANGTFSGLVTNNQTVEGFFKVKIQDFDGCELTAPFTGSYIVEQISGDGLLGDICGPDLVELLPVGINRRIFYTTYLPMAGGFTGFGFPLHLDCGEVIFPLWDSGLGCSEGSIKIIGDNPPATFDPTDDNVILINVINYYENGGCGESPIPSVLKLTKQ